MKKSRKPGAGGKSGSFFSKGKRASSHSRGSGKSFLKGSTARKPGKKKGFFQKPFNDPGPKTGPEPDGAFPTDTDTGYQTEGAMSGVQQALGSTGCGCCSSIAGLVWITVLGIIAAVIILALKCGGC